MTTNQPYPEQQYPVEPPAPYQPYPQVRQRPLGVTVLAILEILGGLFQLLAAFGAFAIAALINVQEVRDAIGDSVPQWVLDNAALIFGVVGVFCLIVAVLLFVLAWAFLKGKKWARVLAIVLLAVSIVSAVVSSLGSLSVLSLGISIVIPVIIVVYLYMPSSKAWFTQ